MTEESKVEKKEEIKGAFLSGLLVDAIFKRLAQRPYNEVADVLNLMREEYANFHKQVEPKEVKNEALPSNDSSDSSDVVAEQ